MMKAELAYQARDILGEGPVWSVEEQALYWVDIQRPAVQRWELKSGNYQKWVMPTDVGCMALRLKGGAIIALRTGFAFMDFESGVVTPISDPEANLSGTRFNDGKCDRSGRFWAGTMDEEGQKSSGALYKLDRDGVCHLMKSNIGVSNGLGWSPDNRFMYYTDSSKRTIWEYDFDLEKGVFSNERIFVQTPVDYIPDGLTVDADGFIWSAKWDGWRVVCYSPEGSIVREVKLPVQRPTSCMFGGPELTDLYITSASTGLTEREKKEQPLAGSVFVVKNASQGLSEPRYVG
jgi:L-arabinonolactonase